MRIHFYPPRFVYFELQMKPLVNAAELKRVVFVEEGHLLQRMPRI
jgi:hypothetical protein